MRVYARLCPVTYTHTARTARTPTHHYFVIEFYRMFKQHAAVICIMPPASSLTKGLQTANNIKHMHQAVPYM